MNAEQRPADGPHTPPPAHPTWSPRTTLAAVGIAVALAVGGAAAVYAAAAGSSAVGQGPAGPPPGWEGPHGPGPGPGIAAGTLHSHSVASDGKGGFTTEPTQTGAVIASTDDTLTVRSDDGYTQTYTLSAQTRKAGPSLRPGQQVSVRATSANGAATAAVVAVIP